MKNKVIWFGRYLGCRYMWKQSGVIGPNQSQITEVNGVTIRALERDLYSDSKLILKELKDISDEDAIEAAKLIHPLSFCSKKKWNLGRDIRNEASILKSKISYHSFWFYNDGDIDFMESEDIADINHVCILNAYDFLRSRGYVVGNIPKEFYITE